jgi:hypothetical protein
MSRTQVLEWHKRVMEGQEIVKAVTVVFNIGGVIIIEWGPEFQGGMW